MSRLFITSSGTGIGKTFLTAALARHGRKKGHGISAVKPIISGYTAEDFAESDTALLLEALSLPATPENIELISPWRFAAPLSPDMAAVREGKTIDFHKVTEWCHDVIAGPEETVLIEGVGGVMVPLDETHTILDWIAALNIPSVLVVGSYLGTISHTLTALKALGKLPVRAVVINESEVSPVAIEETAATIQRFTSAPVVTLKRNPSLAEVDAVFKLLTM